jgi:hypothetical protein
MQGPPDQPAGCASECAPRCGVPYSLQSAGVCRPPERERINKRRQKEEGVKMLISQYLQVSYQIVFTVEIETKCRKA